MRFKMAAPMTHTFTRFIFGSPTMLKARTNPLKIFQALEYIDPLRQPPLCLMFRTFHWNLVQTLSPRTVTRTHILSNHAIANLTCMGPTVTREQGTNQDKPRDVSLDSNEETVDGSVFVHGDGTDAGESYRMRKEKEAWKQQHDDGAPKTARLMALKIRKELEMKNEKKQEAKSTTGYEEEQHATTTKRKDLDSKGFRTLSHQVQDLSHLEDTTVATILYRSIIYNEGDMVAINKPYGLPSHGGPGVTHSVNSLLPLLTRKLKLDKDYPNAGLYIVHRLDKETTGVMLLAKTEETARRVHRMFIRHEVGKKYWLVTVGVPEPPEGIVDIPMVETEVGSRHRMGIRPDIASVYKGLGKLGGGGGQGTKALTAFRVLSENGSAALVEVKPETGVKHQIRVHMALGMGCPILGDHKYSHDKKIAPQRLPLPILQRLGIRQAKARTVPMHLHAREIALPEFLPDGRNLFISTRAPKFFQQNMKRLKLKAP